MFKTVSVVISNVSRPAWHGGSQNWKVGNVGLMFADVPFKDAFVFCLVVVIKGIKGKGVYYWLLYDIWSNWE